MKADWSVPGETRVYALRSSVYPNFPSSFNTPLEKFTHDDCAGLFEGGSVMLFCFVT